MHISSVNISQRVTEQASQLPTHMMWNVAFRLAYLYLILAIARDQGHTNCDCDYITNDDI